MKSEEFLSALLFLFLKGNRFSDLLLTQKFAFAVHGLFLLNTYW